MVDSESAPANWRKQWWFLEFRPRRGVEPLPPVARPFPASCVPPSWPLAPLSAPSPPLYSGSPDFLHSVNPNIMTKSP